MFNWNWLPGSGLLVLALRNMLTRWVRTLLTALGIIVGVAAIVSVSTTNASTLNSINRFFDETAGRSHLLVEAAVAGESFDAAITDVAGRFSGVQAAAPALLTVTLPADEAESWEAQFGAGGSIVPGSTFWLMGIDPEVDVEVNNYVLVQGRLLEAGETAHNIILVDSYAEDKRLELGKDFALVTAGGSIARFRVIGLIAKEGVGITNEGVVGFAPLTAVQDAFAQAGRLSQIQVVVDEAIAGDPDSLDTFRRRLSDRLGTEVAVKYPISRGQLVTNSLRNYQLGLNFFSVVSLFVGSFLIYNAFAMTIVERTREIGMLRAVGTTRGQVLVLVLFEAVTLGILGSLLGVVGGLLLARGLIQFMVAFTGRSIEAISAAPASLLQAALVGLLVTLVAALLPALQAARISPLQALRVQGSINEGRWFDVGFKFGPVTVTISWLFLYQVPWRQELTFFVGSGSIFLLLLGATLCIPILTGVIEQIVRPAITFTFGNEGRLGSSNINRARGRTTLTVAALMAGISMVVGINGLTGSFKADLQEWVDTTLGGDLYVRSPLRMRGEIEGRLLALDDVAAVTKARYVGSRLIPAAGEGEFVIFSAVDPATYLAVGGLKVEEGTASAEAMRQLAAGDTVLISNTLAQRFNLSVGDWITLETRRGQRSFRIAAVVVDFTGGETPVVTGSWSDLRRYFGVNDVDRFTVALRSGASPEAVSHVIENDVGRGQHLSVETRGEFERKVLDLSRQAFALFDVLGLIGLLIAALGVTNTMMMNVLERTRELGSLRSLGMTQAQVRRMILAEAAAMGLMGAVFGLAFGVVLVDVFITGLRQMGGFTLTSRVPYQAMVVSFFVAFLVALGASWYPAIRAGRVNIIEAIKNE